VRRLSILFATLVLLSCGREPWNDTVEGQFGFTESSLEAAGILAFVNSPKATFETLDKDVGLDARAARNIVDHVLGPDSVLGTGDDDPFDSLEELDAIPYVGPVALNKLLAYATANGYVPTTKVEGVAFTEFEQAAVLALANKATLETLDKTVHLDVRAAKSIVDNRPLADLQALSELAYVGPAALTAMRDFVHTCNKSMPIASDGSWRAAGGKSAKSVPAAKWYSVAFDDTQWPLASAPPPNCCGWESYPPQNPWEQTVSSMWEPGDQFAAFFRNKIELPADALVFRALVTVVADDDVAVWLNGKEIFREADFGVLAGNQMPPNKLDLTELLLPGSNTIALHALDTVGGCRWAVVNGTVEYLVP